MNSTQVKYFLETAKTLNFSEAARTLYVSQPAISRQISLLEQELGITLFTRSTHGIALTETGQRLNELFTDFQDRLQMLLTQDGSGRVTQIYIDIHEGRSASTVSELLIAAKDFMKAASPEIQVAVSTQKFSALNKSLRLYNDHMIVAPTDLIELDDGIESLPIKQDQIVLMYAETLFGRGYEPNITDFSTKPIFTFDSNAASSAYQENIRSRLKAFGIKSPVKDMTSMDNILNNIIYGKGYTMTGIAQGETPELPALKYYPLPSSSQLCAFYRKDCPQIIKNLARYLSVR